MIPDLPDGVSLDDTLEFYNNLWSNLESQSTVHVHWHTHRKNPATCWICDMYALVSKMLSIYDTLLTKSSVDNEISLSSASDSDTEIENDISGTEIVSEDTDADGLFGKVNQPEYDIEDYER